VILPIFLPIALILWAIWRGMNRKTVKVVTQKADGD
jgi:hypothetical protein